MNERIVGVCTYDRILFSLKWKDILATWMNPDYMMLSDNQSQKDKILYDSNYVIYLEW